MMILGLQYKKRGDTISILCVRSGRNNDLRGISLGPILGFIGGLRLCSLAKGWYIEPRALQPCALRLGPSWGQWGSQGQHSHAGARFGFVDVP